MSNDIDEAFRRFQERMEQIDARYEERCRKIDRDGKLMMWGLLGFVAIALGAVVLRSVI